MFVLAWLLLWLQRFCLLYCSCMHRNTRMFKFILAHESRAWLLHYSPLVLKDVIPEQYFQHHLLLVESIYLLLKDDIVTKDDIVQSSKLLKKYCFLFSSFYGTYILKHLTRNVTLVTGVRHMSAKFSWAVASS